MQVTMSEEFQIHSNESAKKPASRLFVIGPTYFVLSTEMTWSGFIRFNLSPEPTDPDVSKALPAFGRMQAGVGSRIIAPSGEVPQFSRSTQKL